MKRIVRHARGPLLADGVQPRLSLALSGAECNAFVVEELTVNPYFQPRSSLEAPPCDLWIECLVRVKDGEVSLADLPEIAVSFRDFTGTRYEPQPQLYSDDHGTFVDVNELCYAEIWASFIPSIDGRGDFMKTGYKHSARVMGSNVDFAHLAGRLEPLDRWSTRSAHATRTEIARDLRTRLLLFAEVIPSFMPSGSADVPVPRGLAYPGTTISVDPRVPAGALAFRRRPWTARTEGADCHGVVIPCSFSTYRAGLSWCLKPKAIVTLDRAITMKLRAGDGFALWFLFSSVLLTRPDRLRTAFTFQLEIVSTERVQYANIFFRVPRDFLFREGGFTQLQRYPAPPRLFTIWDSFLDCDCYAAHVDGIAPVVPYIINADFLYSKLDFDKVKSLFLLSVALNGMISFIGNVLAAATISSGVTPPRTIHLPWLAAEVSISATLTTLTLVTVLLILVTYCVYSNRLRRVFWPAVAAIALGLLFPFIVFTLVRPIVRLFASP